MRNSPVPRHSVFKNRGNYFRRVKTWISSHSASFQSLALLTLAVRLWGHYSATLCLHFLSFKTEVPVSDKFLYLRYIVGFPYDSVVKNPLASVGAAGDMGLILLSGRSPGGGNGNPLQYSCLGNPMDRGAWRATVRHDWTQHINTHTHAWYVVQWMIHMYWEVNVHQFYYTYELFCLFNKYLETFILWILSVLKLSSENFPFCLCTFPLTFSCFILY